MPGLNLIFKGSLNEFPSSVARQSLLLIFWCPTVFFALYYNVDHKSQKTECSSRRILSSTATRLVQECSNFSFLLLLDLRFFLVNSRVLNDGAHRAEHDSVTVRYLSVRE